MKTFFASQEIIFLTNTKFAAKELLERETPAPGTPKKAPREKLANDCWNGMLRELLPELSIFRHNRPLPIWELQEGNNLFYLKLGERDVQPEAEFSLNPYRFYSGERLN